MIFNIFINYLIAEILAKQMILIYIFDDYTSENKFRGNLSKFQ
jgi:hypothetical protein